MTADAPTVAPAADPAPVLIEVDGRVARLTLNRPEVLNAFNNALLQALTSAVDGLEALAELRVVIVTGAGTKAFSAGADIASVAAMTAEEGLAYRMSAHRLLERMERSRLIFMAAINGYAFGGGLEFALACDLRLLSENAKLALPELTVGLIPGWGGVQRLSRLAGTAITMDVVLTNRRLSAAEAMQFGVASRVVPPERLLGEAAAMAAAIAKLSPIAVRQVKKSVREGREMTLAQALAYDVEVAHVNFATADRVEGLRAFLEKREPRFCAA